MRSVLRSLALGTAIVAPTALFTAAQAEPIEGWYSGAGIGANWLEESDIDVTGGTNTDADFDEGLAGILTGGYGFGNGFRAEIELGYRSNDIDSISGTNAGSGELDAWTLMGNVLYDVRTGGPITPYLGLGLGAVVADASFTPVNGGTFSDDDTQAAYQGIAGVQYGLSDQWKLFADYRYTAAFSDLEGSANGSSAEAEWANHAIMVGFRYAYGAPKQMAAAPEPAPEPQPPMPTNQPTPALVFFDWDSAVLQDPAKDTIDTAIRQIDVNEVTRVRVTGHADTSGPSRYNMELSERRAQAVTDYMVSQGIPREDIGIRYEGESDPLVPTDDGVREPQNRRAQVIITLAEPM